MKKKREEGKGMKKDGKEKKEKREREKRKREGGEGEKCTRSPNQCETDPGLESR